MQIARNFYWFQKRNERERRVIDISREINGPGYLWEDTQLQGAKQMAQDLNLSITLNSSSFFFPFLSLSHQISFIHSSILSLSFAFGPINSLQLKHHISICKMSWIRSAVNKAVEVGGNNNLSRAVRSYADTVVNQAVVGGTKLIQDRIVLFANLSVRAIWDCSLLIGRINF